MDDRDQDEKMIDGEEANGTFKAIGCTHEDGGMIGGGETFSAEEVSEAEQIRRDMRNLARTIPSMHDTLPIWQIARLVRKQRADR